MRTLLYLTFVICLFQATAVLSQPLKVAFVYVDPVSYGGWSARHEAARQKLQEHFGDQIETSFVDGVPEGTDGERVIRNLARRGNDMIFATSYGYFNAAVRVAREFPQVKLEHATGYSITENLGVYGAREYQARFLNGIVAGAVSESGVLGYVGAFPLPELIRDINAFALGAKMSNPDIEIRVVWVNAWSDPPREREAAEALIGQGVDVITHSTSTTAVLQAAEINGIYSTGFYDNFSEQFPNSQITAGVYDWFPLFSSKIQSVLDGTYQSENRWTGLNNGTVYVVPSTHPVVTDDLVEIVLAEQDALMSGEKTIFAGPLYDIEGNLRVAEGETASDTMLLEMDWYVPGVEGFALNAE